MTAGRSSAMRGWSWDDVLPYFIRSEDQAAIRPPTTCTAPAASGGSRTSVCPGRSSTRFTRRLRSRPAIPKTNDFNRGNNEGVGYFHVNQRSGMCAGTRRSAFLKPAQGLAPI